MSQADAGPPEGSEADRLRGHARRLEQIIERFGEGFCAFDFEWRFIWCNRAAERHLGFAPGGAIGRVLWEAVPSTAGSALEPMFREAMTQREPREGEAPSAERPGLIMALRAFPIDDGLAVAFHDVTERIHADRRWREQAQRLELTLAASGLGDWSWDPETDLVTLSERASAMFGAPPGPVMSWATILERIHPDDAGAVADAVQKAIFERTPYAIEFRIKPPERDEEIWVASRAQPEFGADGRPIGLYGVVGDISQAKAQEAQLRESEARFRAMADSAPAPVWVTEADGPIAFVNQAFAEFAGRPAATLLGDVWLELIHRDDLPEVARRRAAARQGPHAYWIEARFKHGSGEWRWMRASSRPRFDTRGVFKGYVGLAVDMTEIRAAETRQQLLINELNHRVKNTLATVQSIAHQTLRDDAMRGPRDRLTERLLALSAAHNVLTRENWESAELRQIALEAVRPYDGAEPPRIRLSGPTVRLTPNVALAVSLALHELATNATKYGALSVPAGRIDIGWTPTQRAGQVEIVWREVGGPAVKDERGAGFGSRLLSTGLAAELGRPAEISYGREGVVCTFVAPHV